MKKALIIACSVFLIAWLVSVVFMWPPLCPYVGRRGAPSTGACVLNLMALDSAQEQWAMANTNFNGGVRIPTSELSVGQRNK